MSYLFENGFLMWLQGSLPIFSQHVAISGVDNVLMVHQSDSQVLLYDILTNLCSSFTSSWGGLLPHPLRPLRAQGKGPSGIYHLQN